MPVSGTRTRGAVVIPSPCGRRSNPVGTAQCSVLIFPEPSCFSFYKTRTESQCQPARARPRCGSFWPSRTTASRATLYFFQTCIADGHPLLPPAPRELTTETKTDIGTASPSFPQTCRAQRPPTYNVLTGNTKTGALPVRANGPVRPPLQVLFTHHGPGRAPPWLPRPTER